MKSPRVLGHVVSLATGLSIVAAACSSASGTPPAAHAPKPVARPSTPTAGPPTAVDGMYYSAASILSFRGGLWTRNLPAMEGTFMVTGDQLVLTQSDCPGAGTYSWSLEADVLTLTKVQDACAQRDVQFASSEKWGVVHELGKELKNGQGLLLDDGQHVANYHGQLDVTARTTADVEVSLTNTSGLIFSPTVLIGSPGQTITLTITNPRRPDTERLQHNFKIDELGISAEVPFGESAVVTLTFPQSGGLRFYCGYHARFNQQGEVLVGV
jgi:plastocyanin